MRARSAASNSPSSARARRRLCFAVRGAVQGVGFRPFVHRLAGECHLSGWVGNSVQGVAIEVEGSDAAVKEFLLRLTAEAPPRASIQGLEASYREPEGYAGFEIRASDTAGAKTALVPPDIATCDACVREVFDPADRRYRYPFTNCSHCGPRFSIVEARPYDRARTTMRAFEMCDACLAEYTDPSQRRFHAQPNACPACGPRLELWDAEGRRSAGGELALREAARAIRSGAILAVKGIGGFHLMVDAGREDCVSRLRKLKHREERPFAVMLPDLRAAARDCEISELEARVLRSPEAPIVLLKRRRGTDSGRASVCASVAPGHPTLGVMLPYSPLHHLLLCDLGFPVVATSGNLSDEPICIDECEAVERLRGIADAFLVHDRPIARHVDDSVVRIAMGRELVLRRARGFAPLQVARAESATALLAVGGHFKSAIAVTNGGSLILSQHLGDLETAPAHDAFRKAIGDLETLYEQRAERVVCDLHPDYRSTRFARRGAAPVQAVQHHHAHVAACMADNDLEGSVLGVAWDGAGLGPDGTVWGGEFLRADRADFTRFAHFRSFRLPGGDAAAREPRRSALGVLFEIWGEAALERTDLPPVAAFTPAERRVLREMLGRGLHSPITSSAGRLFDAVAALIGLRQRTSFEGQAASELEFAALRGGVSAPYRFRLAESDGSKAPSGAGEAACSVDWEPLIRDVLVEHSRGVPREEIAARFHESLAAIVAAVAERCGERRVVLSGGCFQNAFLTERAVARLEAAGLRAFWHQRIPPNDGGIAAGQAIVALSSRPKES